MVRDGYFYGLGLAAVAAALWYLTGAAWTVAPPLVLAAFFLWFFRDPSRKIPPEPGLIVSPADGVVTEADWIQTPKGVRLKMSIFLNVFNVHVNRSPITGTVSTVDYRKGRFLNAMNPESSALNEQSLIVVQAEGYEVAFKQIAGLLARRIVCRVKPGEHVERGQRIGLIKFGSRVDLLLPEESELLVKKGTRVRGGSTVLAAVVATGLTPEKAREIA
jgi:phosphatidylserine decarboxylase